MISIAIAAPPAHHIRKLRSESTAMGRAAGAGCDFDFMLPRR